MLQTTAALSDKSVGLRIMQHGRENKLLSARFELMGMHWCVYRCSFLLVETLKKSAANTHLWKLLRVSKATLRMQLLVLQKTHERKCAGCGDKSKTGFRVTSNRPTHPQPGIFHLFSPSVCFHIPFLSRPTSLNKTLSQIKWAYSTFPLYI